MRGESITDRQSDDLKVMIRYWIFNYQPHCYRKISSQYYLLYTSILHTNNIYPGEGAVQSRDDMLHSTLATREGELCLSLFTLFKFQYCFF